MLADHVVSDILQGSQIECHGFYSRRSVNSVWPITLVECAKRENKFAVQKRALNAVDHASRNGSESGITLDRITSKFDCDVIQGWTIRRPKIW